jgi:hypothetical protein
MEEAIISSFFHEAFFVSYQNPAACACEAKVAEDALGTN